MSRPSPLLALPHSREIGALRRIVDIVVVMAVAPIILTILLFLSALIKIDSPGPVFFSQQRLGAGGRRFRVWKLRTMVVGAESMKQELLHLNTLTLPDFKLEHDPRVTRVGRLLRTASLDELPQLLQVLRGEMTLIGPRACSIDVREYELWQTERLEHRPGLFGAWQADHRATANFTERCRIEISDSRSRTPFHDLMLAARSILAVVRHKGAH